MEQPGQMVMQTLSVEQIWREIALAESISAQLENFESGRNHNRGTQSKSSSAFELCQSMKIHFFSTHCKHHRPMSVLSYVVTGLREQGANIQHGCEFKYAPSQRRMIQYFAFRDRRKRPWCIVAAGNLKKSMQLEYYVRKNKT